MTKKQSRLYGAAQSKTAAGSSHPLENDSITTGARLSMIRRADGRVIGEVRRDGFFQKHLRSSTHFLREPRAIAFDVLSLADAERAGAHSVEIHDDETGLIYRATIRRIRARGFRVARRHGEQIGLRLTEFNRNDSDLDAPRVSQPSLFGGER